MVSRGTTVLVSQDTGEEFIYETEVVGCFITLKDKDHVFEYRQEDHYTRDELKKELAELGLKRRKLKDRLKKIKQ